MSGSPSSHPLLERLAGGDRRSIGRADAVATAIAGDQRLFDAVFRGMTLGGDPVVRMRAADAVEKASRERPALLRRHRRALLRELLADPQQEVRWHAAQMLPRLDLDAEELADAAAALRGLLDDPGRIVRVNAMQALAELARRDPAIRQELVPTLRRLARSGAPSLRARARKLLADLADEP